YEVFAQEYRARLADLPEMEASPNARLAHLRFVVHFARFRPLTQRNGFVAMRVMITGAAGFLGSHLCDRVLAEGHEVIGMDNLITGSTDNIAHLAGHKSFTFVHYDVTHYLYVEGPLDAVLHF